MGSFVLAHLLSLNLISPLACRFAPLWSLTLSFLLPSLHPSPHFFLSWETPLENLPSQDATVNIHKESSKVGKKCGGGLNNV